MYRKPLPELPAEELKAELESELVGSHGFERLKRSRIPGNYRPIGKDSIEVCPLAENLQEAEQTPLSLVRARVQIPVDGPVADPFARFSCADHYFLASKEEVVLRSRTEISDAVEKILGLTESAIAYLKSWKLEPHDFIGRDFDELDRAVEDHVKQIQESRKRKWSLFKFW